MEIIGTAGGAIAAILVAAGAVMRQLRIATAEARERDRWKDQALFLSQIIMESLRRRLAATGVDASHSRDAELDGVFSKLDGKPPEDKS